MLRTSVYGGHNLPPGWNRVKVAAKTSPYAHRRPWYLNELRKAYEISSWGKMPYKYVMESLLKNLIWKSTSQKFLNKITVWPELISIKVKKSWLLLPQHQSTYPRGSESALIEIPPFRSVFIEFSKTVLLSNSSCHLYSHICNVKLWGS